MLGVISLKISDKTSMIKNPNLRVSYSPYVISIHVLLRERDMVKKDGI